MRSLQIGLVWDCGESSKWLANKLDYKIKQVFFNLTTQDLAVNKIDLQAATLQDPLEQTQELKSPAVLYLPNRLYMLRISIYANLVYWVNILSV